MPRPRTTSMPVRTWTKVELSPIGLAPTRTPRRAHAETNKVSSVGALARRTASLRSRPLRPVTSDRAVEVAQRGGAEEHDEDAGEDAEHHREEQLHRCLLRVLLGQLSPLDPNLLGLGPEDPPHGHA